MKTYRIKIEAIQFRELTNNPHVQVVDYEDSTVREIVKSYLSKSGLILTNNYSFKYGWQENTLYVLTTAIPIDDLANPAITGVPF